MRIARGRKIHREIFDPCGDVSGDSPNQHYPVRQFHFREIPVHYGLHIRDHYHSMLDVQELLTPDATRILSFVSLFQKKTNGKSLNHTIGNLGYQRYAAFPDLGFGSWSQLSIIL